MTPTMTPTMIGRIQTAAAGSDLTITGVGLRPVLAPLPTPLKTAAGQLDHVAVLLVALELSGGLTGLSYIFTPRPDMLSSLQETISALVISVQGRACDPLALSAFWDQQYLLVGGTGIVTMARAAIDMAMWDAIAKDQGKPFYQLFNGTDGPVPTYESSGLGLSSRQVVADEAAGYVQNGFREMKLRLGYPTLAQDLDVLQAVRRAVGPNIGLMVDYNQSLGRAEAQERCAALDTCDLIWIEEPLIAADLEGAAQLKRGLKTPIQLGENLFSAVEVARALTLESSDYLMPDVMKIGGATHWLLAAEAAQEHGIAVSSHLFPEISVQLLASVENRHFLEYVNWMDAISAAPVCPENGYARASSSPGIGVAWNESAIAKYLI